MPGLGKPIMPEDSIIRGLVLNSKDLFSKEAYEERVDKELAELIIEFRKNKTVDKGRLNDVIGNFIKDVAAIIQELDQIKIKAEQEEILKIDGLRKLFGEESKINAGSLRKELEKFAASIKGSTIAALRRNLRAEKRLRRGKEPLGYVLKKLKNDLYLDAEVAGRAYRIGEHTAEEHALFYRTMDLINSVKRNPSPENLEQLKKFTKVLIQNYRNDIGDFLNIEIDIKIEEARKLHRIDHYIVFLKMIKSIGNFDDLIKRLESLKKFVNNWVYQDTTNAKQLERYAIKSFEYGEHLLKASESSIDQFPDIVVENRPIVFPGITVPGLLIYNKTKPWPNRGIVLAHAVFATKEALLALGKRLASQDFLVYSIDIASHGESKDQFRLGITSEYILTAVRWFRSNGITNVGVVGHSLGSVCTLFALCGYNRKVELEFFEASAELQKKIYMVGKELEGDMKKGKKFKLASLPQLIQEKQDFLHASEEYGKIKKIILDGLRNVYESNSKIDAAVLLSLPKTCQMFFPPAVAFLIKQLGNKGGRPVGKFITKAVGSIIRKQEGENAIYPKLIDEKGKVQATGAVMSDVYDCFDYAQKVKNPYDFMEAITYFCDNIKKPDKVTNFIHYYRDYIRNVPKLYVFGLADKKLLMGFWKGLMPFAEPNIVSLEQHYKNFGAVDIVRIPSTDHFLNTEIHAIQFESGKLPRITYKIVTFLNQYLGRGRLV